MAESEVKLELAADLDRARARLAGSFAGVRKEMNVAAHLKRSFHENKVAYIGGATFFGLLLSRITGGGRGKTKKAGKGVKEIEKAGIWLIVLQFLLKTLGPVLSSLLEKQVTGFVKSRTWKRE